MKASLAHPAWLPLLGALALACALWVGLGLRQRRTRLARLLGPGAALPAPGDALLLLALAALAIALVGPRLGTHTVRVPASGIDVVVMLDVSRSMDARDVPPSRLDRARRAAEVVLSSLDAGDRAALAAFAGRGVLLTPLTHDQGALREMLPAFDATLLGAEGSDLESGIRAALGAFARDSARPRVVLVLSDGEDPSSPIGRAGAALAQAAEARVVTVAFGSDDGATIPTVEGPLRDARGRVVTTRRDAGRLAALAAASDGEALRADVWGGVDAGALLGSVRRDAAHAPDGFVEREVPVLRSAPLAALALFLLLLEAGAFARRSRPSGPSAGAAAALAVLLLGAGPGEAPAPGPFAARARPAAPAPAVLLRSGVARAEAGDFAGAERAFAAAALAARDPRLAADAYYDLGLAALRRGQLEAARDAFFDALALAPGDRGARFNLEWTLRRLALPRPAESPPRGRAPQEPDEPRPEAGEPEPDAAAELEHPAPAPAPAGPLDPGEGAAAPALSPEEAARWLGRVQDDPARALRAAARDGTGAERRRGGGW